MDENASLAQSDTAPGRGGTLWILWLSLLVFAYPLSIGPAAKLHKRFPASRPAIEAFYRPLTSLIDRNKALRAVAQWYVADVWRCN
jgi:hypothetical protein